MISAQAAARSGPAIDFVGDLSAPGPRRPIPIRLYRRIGANGIVVAVPGALNAGLDTLLFWGSLSFSLFVAGLAAFPVNRALLRRGKGHAAVHATGVHGGPNVKVVGVVTALAGAFGAAVLLAEAIG